MRGVVPPLPHTSSCPAAYLSIGENSYTVNGGRVVHPPAETRDAINMSVAISTLQRVMSADNTILIPCHGTIRDLNDGFKTWRPVWRHGRTILLGSVYPVGKCSTLQAASVNDTNFCVNQSLVKLDYFTTPFNCIFYIGTKSTSTEENEFLRTWKKAVVLRQQTRTSLRTVQRQILKQVL